MPREPMPQRFTMVLDGSLRVRAERLADAERRSLSSMMNVLALAALPERERAAGLVEPAEVDAEREAA